MIQNITLKRQLTENQAEQLKGQFLDETSFDQLITYDCDGYDANGLLVFKFRKQAIPHEVVKSGYESFKDSITLTDGRGMAAGGNAPRIRKDGSISKIMIASKVFSGNAGYMDAGAMVHYCRRTAFARDYFEKFKTGIPFVEYIDGLYKELCPEHYARQIKISLATNQNYRIGGTSFTTVTVNRNFQTAVHKDSGDLPDGFGNLCVYRQGHYDGSYFCLPEYRTAIDMHTGDILFVDVHRFHGNTPFKNQSKDFMRVAFVMYYREGMIKCQGPAEELHRIKMEETGFLRL